MSAILPEPLRFDDYFLHLLILILYICVYIVWSAAIAGTTIPVSYI